ncbi:transcriptional regulatory protein LGE1-like [Spinacia oleracea]|uniref:Transcriptional regulatory protein LGE1-like n=1 Tax=Spinacia oleracea TaxID=3562 RepID=A0ABM3QQD7_SPIOL|nr:transcriptional regulatory protein LGE1-like [Spinacia oleracea]
MPSNTSFCDICGGHDHFPNMCHLLQNGSFVEHDSSYEQDFDIEYENALNERLRYDGPPNPNFSRQQAPRGPSMHAYQGGSYQGQGQGGGFDHQGRGNYRGQGYQGQTLYSQPHGLGNQDPYHQASYNPNHQGGMGYNYQYRQGGGVSSGGYPLNSGNQYGNSQYPPSGFNVPRTCGSHFPPNPFGFGNAPPPLL